MGGKESLNLVTSLRLCKYFRCGAWSLKMLLTQGLRDARADLSIGTGYTLALGGGLTKSAGPFAKNKQ